MYIHVCACMCAHACAIYNIAPEPKAYLGPYLERNWKDYKSQWNRNFAMRFYLLEMSEKLCPQSLINKGPSKTPP